MLRSVISLLLVFAVICHAGQSGDRVLLKTITSLVLKQDKWTTGHRTDPVQQLRCTSGCASFFPTTVMCENVGWDGRSVVWHCKGDLPAHVGFGTQSVSCEGYTNPTDEYVLAGSCGLTFTLVQNKVSGASSHSSSHSDSSSSTSSSSSFQALWLILAVIAFCCGVFILVSICGNSSSYTPIPTVYSASSYPPNYTHAPAPIPAANYGIYPLPVYSPGYSSYSGNSNYSNFNRPSSSTTFINIHEDGHAKSHSKKHKNSSSTHQADGYADTVNR